MKRCLAVATLALGLVAFGCDDDGDGGGTGGRGGTGGAGGTGGTGGATGGTGGATGGTGGATGGTGGATGGTGGATGGTGGGGDASDGGDTPSGETSGDVPAEAGGDTAAAGWTNCATQNPKLGVSANEFCMQYMTACGFGEVMGRTAANSFATMGECVTRYNTYADPGTASTGKGCAAYHLCQASQTGQMMVHCPHPAQAGGPCMLPARP